jgi:hypothetical protein
LFFLLPLLLLATLLPDRVAEFIHALRHQILRREQREAPLGVPSRPRAVPRVQIGLQLKVLHTLLHEGDQRAGWHIIDVDRRAHNLALRPKGERRMRKP